MKRFFLSEYNQQPRLLKNAKCLSNNSLLVDHILPNIGLVYFRSKRAGPSMFNQNNVVGPLGELGLKAKSNSLIQCTSIQSVYNDNYRKHDMLYSILKIQNKHSPKVGVDESHCEAVKGFSISGLVLKLLPVLLRVIQTNNASTID